MGIRTSCGNLSLSCPRRGSLGTRNGEPEGQHNCQILSASFLVEFVTILIVAKQYFSRGTLWNVWIGNLSDGCKFIVFPVIACGNAWKIGHGPAVVFCFTAFRCRQLQRPGSSNSSEKRMRTAQTEGKPLKCAPVALQTKDIYKEQHVPIAEIKWLHKHSFSPEDVDAKSSILTALWNANPQALQTCILGLRVDVVAVCCS